MKKILSIFILFSFLMFQAVTPSFAAIALVTSTVKGGTFSGATSDAIDTTGANLIVLHVSSADANTVTDSKSNTWTALTSKTSGSGNIGRLYYCVNPTVGSGHTFSVTSIVPTISVLAFSGVKTSSPFDVENGSSCDSTGSCATGSITPSEDNELVVTGMSMGGAEFTDYVADSGFTNLTYVPVVGGAHFGGGFAYKIQTTAVAVNPTWSGTSPAWFAVTIASFKAAAVAATTTALLMDDGL